MTLILASLSKGSRVAKIAILLLVPKNKLSQHIKTLANIARLMSDDSLREKLLKIKTPEGILKELKKQNKAKK